MSPLELGRPIADQLRHTQLGEQLTETIQNSLAIQNHRAAPHLPAINKKGIQRVLLKEKLK